MPSYNDKFREAADEFARRVAAELGDAVDSVVLYGSVARGDARAESDIDLLVIAPERGAVKETVFGIADELTAQSGYANLIEEFCYGRDHFQEMRRIGSPFILNVLSEGVALYDNGTFKAARERLLANG